MAEMLLIDPDNGLLPPKHLPGLMLTYLALSPQEHYNEYQMDRFPSLNSIDNMAF